MFAAYNDIPQLKIMANNMHEVIFFGFIRFCFLRLVFNEFFTDNLRSDIEFYNVVTRWYIFDVYVFIDGFRVRCLQYLSRSGAYLIAYLFCISIVGDEQFVVRGIGINFDCIAVFRRNHQIGHVYGRCFCDFGQYGFCVVHQARDAVVGLFADFSQ